MMKSNITKILIIILVFAAGLMSAFWYMHQKDNHYSHHMTLDRHDEANMPGLQGVDTTEIEINDLKNIFINHKDITRTVKNIPNGIITITETKNESLRENIVNHVSMMLTRLQENRNPQVIIQTPTLNILFENYDKIETEVVLTDTGVQIIQTSSDSVIVAALQQHAAEVSDMAKSGMKAVHERMMKDGQSHH